MPEFRLLTQASAVLCRDSVQLRIRIGQWLAVFAALGISLTGIARFAIGGTQPSPSVVLLPACVSALAALVLMAARLHAEARQTEVARQAARIMERKYTHLLDATADLAMLVDRDGRITFANRAIEARLGRQAWELVGTRFADLATDPQQFRAGWMIEAARNCYLPTPTRLPLKAQTGDDIFVEAVATNRLDDDAIGAIVVIARDITREVRLAHERDAAACTDRLTGLPNRAEFMRLLSSGMNRAARLHRPLAVAVLDIDNFRLINDTLGASGGDAILTSVAARLKADSTALMGIGRLAGDRFAIALEECDAADVRDKVREIQRRAVDGHSVAGRPIPVSGSIGVRLWMGEDPANPGELVSQAEMALTSARRLGPGCLAVYDDSMAAPVDRLQLESDLRQAIARQEFTVHYQPVVSLDGGEVEEMEALVRWNHPDRGLMAPGRFIPIAEETGLIVPIGWWVLREACEQGARWMAQRPSRPLTISVNLSPRMFRQEDLVPRVRAVLAASNFPPAHLRLEITESVMIDDRALATRQLQQLKAIGVQIAIDDFGTGYSSLSYLQHFPIDVIKIDRAFISTMGESRQSSEIVRSIIALARALQMETTGEGVETEHQLAQLREFGSTRGQGYFFSKPMPACDIDAILQTAVSAGFAA